MRSARNLPREESNISVLNRVVIYVFDGFPQFFPTVQPDPSFAGVPEFEDDFPVKAIGSGIFDGPILLPAPLSSERIGNLRQVDEISEFQLLSDKLSARVCSYQPDNATGETASV